MRAHTSVAACAGDVNLVYPLGGNAIVDAGAKEGAALHPHNELALKRVKSTVAVVKELVEYMGTVSEFRWDSNMAEFQAAKVARAAAPAIQRPREAGRPIYLEHRACLDISVRRRCVIVVVFRGFRP